MPSDDYLLSILATFKDSASPELRKFGKAVLGAGKATGTAGKQADGFGNKLATLGAKFISVKAAAQQVGQMFQQAFDFAEMGAQSLQTTAAFGDLLHTLDAAPDTLDQLRSASRNTISDLDLMASTSTLLAGAQGELATALAGSTPKLMEIAKAANALNPSLGDTNFLYQSLATGIKRASPMILDNLGLMIKVGDANERFAEAAGKSVDQLTAEEQKMALLNETMRAGQVLIEQAGDNIDSVTDDFARFETAITNAKTAMAEMAVPVLVPLLEQLSDLFTISEKETAALDRAKDAAERLAETSEEYTEIVREQLILEGIREGETRKAMEGRLAITKAGTIAIMDDVGRAIMLQRKFVGAYIATNKRLGLSTKELEKRYDELTQQLEDYGAGVIELDWATTELGAEQQKQQEELEALVQSYYEFGDVTNINTEGAQKAADAALETAAALEAERIAVQELGAGLHAIGPKLTYAVDREEALERIGLRAAAAQQLLDDSLSDLGIAMRGAVGRQMASFIGDQTELSTKLGNTREELRLLEEKLGGMSRGYGIGQLRADLEGIVVEMHALGPEPEELNRGREAVMRTLEVRHLEANEALQAQEAAAGAYAVTTKKAEELRAEIRELEGQMHDTQLEHEQATEGIIFDLAQQAIESMGLIESMGQPAVDLQWALAEAMGQIDYQTLQVWNATQRINRLYEEGAITLDETVGLFEKLADIAAEPIEPQIIAPEDIAFQARAGIFDFDPEMADLPEGMQGLFDEIEEARLTAMPEVIESEIKIENLDVTKEAFSSIESMVRYISGQHTVSFNIKASGEWPGSAGGPPAAVTPGGRPYPGAQFGGVVAETGLAFVHAGELIIPPMEAQQMREGAGGTTITEGDVNNFNLNVTSVQEMSSLIQEFEVMRALAG